MRILFLLVLCGCNQVFGLHQTQQSPPDDAQLFDAPNDGPYLCPQIGTAPQFSPMLHQVIDQSCTGYLPTASGFAIGTCGDIGGLGYGAVDQPLTLAVGLQSDSSFTLDEVRLAPSGEVAYVRMRARMASFYMYAKYQLSNGIWMKGPSLPFNGLSNLIMSSIARGPAGDRLLLIDNTNKVIRELMEDPGAPSGWTEILPSYPLAELQLVRLPSFVGLTTDGLRIVFEGILSTDPNLSSQMLYVDRPALTNRFGHPLPLLGIPLVSSPYMLADCSRVYLTGLDTVFYAYGRQP